MPLKLRRKTRGGEEKLFTYYGSYGSRKVEE